MGPARRRASRGYTLTEVLVVTLILSVLTAVAVPGLSTLLASRRVQTTTQRLLADLAMARNEAVKRNAPVLLCADGADATDQCTVPSASAWLRGWKLCRAQVGNVACLPSTSADPSPLRTQERLAATLVVTGPAAPLRFMPDGTLQADAFTAFRIDDAAAPGRAWSIRLSPSGAFSASRN